MHSHASLVANKLGYLNKSDLARVFNVGRTAGARIDSLNLNDANTVREVKLASVFKSFKLVRRGIICSYRMALKDRAVCKEIGRASCRERVCLSV